MKRSLVCLLVLIAAARAQLQQPAPVEIPFDSVANALKLPGDMNFGEGAGIRLYFP